MIAIEREIDRRINVMTDAMEEYVDNYYLYDFAGHFVEADDNDGENEFDFNTIDIITEEDSSDESEQNESGNDNDNDK